MKKASLEEGSWGGEQERMLVVVGEREEECSERLVAEARGAGCRVEEEKPDADEAEEADEEEGDDAPAAGGERERDGTTAAGLPAAGIKTTPEVRGGDDDASSEVAAAATAVVVVVVIDGGDPAADAAVDPMPPPLLPLPASGSEAETIIITVVIQTNDFPVAFSRWQS